MQSLIRCHVSAYCLNSGCGVSTVVPSIDAFLIETTLPGCVRLVPELDLYSAGLTLLGISGRGQRLRLQAVVVLLAGLLRGQLCRKAPQLDSVLLQVWHGLVVLPRRPVVGLVRRDQWTADRVHPVDISRLCPVTQRGVECECPGHLFLSRFVDPGEGALVLSGIQDRGAALLAVPGHQRPLDLPAFGGQRHGNGARGWVTPPEPRSVRLAPIRYGSDYPRIKKKLHPAVLGLARVRCRFAQLSQIRLGIMRWRHRVVHTFTCASFEVRRRPGVRSLI